MSKSLSEICEQLLGRKLGCYECGKHFMKQRFSHIYCSKECLDKANERVPKGYPWDTAYLSFWEISDED